MGTPWPARAPLGADGIRRLPVADLAEPCPTAVVSSALSWVSPVSRNRLRRMTGPELLFTAPWEPIVERRGDPLGFRALVDTLADGVAPGLSNATADARWVTILAWCMVKAHTVWRQAGGNGLDQPDEVARRYAWQRPLELMWIDRALTLGGDAKRQLPGQRSVKRWAEAKRKPAQFDMTDDQYARYRQSGPYGAYRIAFRRWPGLTVTGDGWTPAGGSRALATWLDQRLGGARCVKLDGGADALHQGALTRARGREDRWWQHAWPEYHFKSKALEATLPSRRTTSVRLPEYAVLQPLAFGEDPGGERRRAIAKLCKSAGTVGHRGICKAIAQEFSKDARLSALPAVAEFADAAMELMTTMAELLNGEVMVTLKEIAAGPGVAPQARKLQQAAHRFLKKQAQVQLEYAAPGVHLATALERQPPVGVLRALVAHHLRSGSGIRWFTMHGDAIAPVPRPPSGFRYRFRLFALCRIAVQCGVITELPAALDMQDPVDAIDFAGDDS